MRTKELKDVRKPQRISISIYHKGEHSKYVFSELINKNERYPGIKRKPHFESNRAIF